LKTKKIHRGEILDKAVKESPVTVTKLVQRMKISRGTYYNHVNNPELPFELLYHYGKIINHDFSNEIPQMNKYVFEEPEELYEEPKTIEEAIRQRNYWRDRFYRLLEKVVAKETFKGNQL
jgi:DNA-binding transcriptional ArsR family regulator